MCVLCSTGNEGLVNLGITEVLKVAEYIDFLFQLIANAMGRGAHPHVPSACVRKYCRTPTCCHQTGPFGLQVFSRLTQERVVHLEPINIPSRSFGEEITPHIPEAGAGGRGLACAPARIALAALPFAAADELWSFGNKSSLSTAAFGLLTLYSAELETFFPSLAQPPAGSGVFVPLWFQSSALLDVSRTFLSFTIVSAAWF